jgi:transcriptional regulator with XRE-family HTH domain
MSDLAAFVKQRVQELGWTERYFEDVSGISKTALRAIMTGETSEPKLGNLVRLAKALDTSLIHLIELCGFPIDDAVLTEEEISVLRQLNPEQRRKLINQARKELDG